VFAFINLFLTTTGGCRVEDQLRLWSRPTIDRGRPDPVAMTERDRAIGGRTSSPVVSQDFEVTRVAYGRLTRITVPLLSPSASWLAAAL
jgi:hypothetical protein